MTKTLRASDENDRGATRTIRAVPDEQGLGAAVPVEVEKLRRAQPRGQPLDLKPFGPGRKRHATRRGQLRKRDAARGLGRDRLLDSAGRGGTRENEELPVREKDQIGPPVAVEVLAELHETFLTSLHVE